MKFKYFDAPESEMNGLKERSDICSICNRVGKVFDLQRTCGSPFDKDSAKDKNGCYTCLTEGRFGFFHITELGFLDEKGLHRDYDEQEGHIFAVGPDGSTTSTVGRFNRPVKNVKDEAVKELWRTPDFPSWNEVSWPVHCDEFMTFLGEWKPKDFPGGCSQFLEMTDRDFQELWPDNAVEPHDWGIAYFAFRCPACARHCGRVDFS